MRIYIGYQDGTGTVIEREISTCARKPIRLSMLFATFETTVEASILTE